MTMYQQLLDRRACDPAMAWFAEQPDQSPAVIWATCPRGDWLCWVMSEWQAWTAVERTVAACVFARRAMDRERAAGREPEPQSWAAVETAERWTRGEATLAEVHVAASDAHTAATAATFASSASYAASSAAYAAVTVKVDYAASAAATFASSASYADYSAVAAAAADYAAATVAESLWQADWIRAHHPCPWI